MTEPGSQRVAVLNCGQLVTLAGPARPRIRDEMRQLAIIPDGVMLISNGRIERVGTRAEISSHATNGYDILDAGGRVVMPGFVDAHTHPVFAGTRTPEYELRAMGATYEQIAQAGGGIRSTVRKTRAATEQELFGTAQRYRQWFLRSGTTTVEGKSGYGLTQEDELKMLRVIRRLDYVPTFLGAHEIPDEYRDDPSGYVDLIVDGMLPAIQELRLAEYCDAFCEPHIFNIEMARRIFRCPHQLGFKLRIHADQLSRSGAAELAAEVGAATADHLEHTDERGIRALAAANVQPVLLPGAVYNLGLSRFAPGRDMIDAGLAVVLATDFNPGSSPTPSIPFVMSVACTHMRMSPAETVTATTINAAYSVGLGSEIGSLEPGKRADFVIHDCQEYREIPYFVAVETPVSVFRHGKLVYTRQP